MKVKLKLSDKQSKIFEPELLRKYPVRCGDAVRTFDWILRCAEVAVGDSTLSPRVEEMRLVCEYLRSQLVKQAPDLYDESGNII